MTYAGYILGFPSDTKESILRDIEIIKRELPLDILSSFSTPLPGFGRPQVFCRTASAMDPDMNKYDLNHRVSHQFEDADKEWKNVYRTAWASYYTPEHARTIFFAVGSRMQEASRPR